MVISCNPSAGSVRQTRLGAFNLVGANIPAQLPNDFHRLGDAGGADGMAARQEAAAGIDHDVAPQ